MFKTKKTLYFVSLALLGSLYLTAFSPLELHPLLKNQAALLPVQIAVLIYLFWWKPRKAGTNKKLS